MLRCIKQLYGNRLGALDAEIGTVKDFYFDDQSLTIRYVVADTGTWLTGRLVLISPRAIGRMAHTGNVLNTHLTRKQIEDSPPIESHKTVSRQFEEEYHLHYGWPYYWQANALWGMSGAPFLPLTVNPASELPDRSTPSTHLRSTKAVSGYHLRARDGLVGHICDFMVDDQTWTIGQWVVKVGHRLTGKEVRIPASTADRISYDESSVFVNLTMESVEHSPGHYEPALPEAV